MKNEPTIAYNHLQEEHHDHSAAEKHEENRLSWKSLLNPVAITIEILAIAAMAFFMIQEMLK